MEAAGEGRADGGRPGVESDGNEERDFRDKPDGAQRRIRRALQIYGCRAGEARH